MTVKIVIAYETSRNGDLRDQINLISEVRGVLVTDELTDRQKCAILESLLLLKICYYVCQYVIIHVL